MDPRQREALKQKTTIAGISAVAGGVAWRIILANFLGWVSPTTAQQHTSDAVQAKVDQVLALFCADRFMAKRKGPPTNTPRTHCCLQAQISGIVVLGT